MDHHAGRSSRAAPRMPPAREPLSLRVPPLTAGAATDGEAWTDVTALERGQLSVMRIHAGLFALFLIAAAALVAGIVQHETGRPALLVLIPLLLVLVYPVLIAPARRFRAWGYVVSNDELRIANGVWTRTETHVPLARVQHVDVSQGPLERGYGVCRLILHTAGTANSRVVLPGLARATAEAIRDEVRARIRQEEP